MSTAIMSTAVRRRWWWLLWGLLTVGALGTAAYFVPPYLVGSTTIPYLDRITPGYYTSLVLHAVPAGLALVTGPWQFVPRFRARYPRAHRVTGRVYLVSVVAGALVALYSSAVTKSGFALQVVFFVLIAAWLYTAAKAFTAIRRREVQVHRVWMVRNYTLTFAAVMLRVYQLPLLAVMEPWGLEYREVYTVSAWLSLLGNVLVAEYFIIPRITARAAANRERPVPVGVR